MNAKTIGGNGNTKKIREEEKKTEQKKREN